MVLEVNASYAQISDIKEMFKNFPEFSRDALVKETAIGDFLQHSFQVINGRIASYYETPILITDSPCSYRVLREVQIFYVSDIVDRILNPDRPIKEGPQWGAKATELLEEIAPLSGEYPKLLLTDANYIGTKIQKAMMSGSTGDPVFTKGGDQW